MPPISPKDTSPYSNFVRDPNEYHPGEEPPYIPMTMVDCNGIVLYETDGFDLLLAIIYRDDVTTLKQYLDITPWVIEEKEELPLYYSFFYTAVSAGSLGALKTLLSHYERVMGQCQRITFRKRGFTLLNEAARRGYLEIVEFLLRNQPLYADIHERDYTGCTAIAAASDLYSTRYIEAFNWQPSVDRSEAVINLLLEWGACPTDVVARAHSYSSWKPETVLSMASEWASAKMIARLVSGSADVHARFTKSSLQLRLYDEQDYIVQNVSAVHMASFHGNFVALETLLAHHGNAVSILEMLSSCDSRGSTALHWATRHNLFNPNSHESVQNIKATIDLILDTCAGLVNIQDVEGNTALHCAARYLCKKGVFMPIFDTICDKGGDASIRNNRGETPLHNVFALEEEAVDTHILSLLLTNGAKVNDIDHAGNTTLHIAARRLDHHGAITFLIEQGADATIRNSKNETPVHIASSGNAYAPGVAEKVEIQNVVLATLTNAGGIELMDVPNAEGKTPRQICKAQRASRYRVWNIPTPHLIPRLASVTCNRMRHHFLVILAGAVTFASGELWPYSRYYGYHDAGFVTSPSRHPSLESFKEPTNCFVEWLGTVVNKNDNYELQEVFENGTISDNATSIESLSSRIATPQQPVIGPQVPNQGSDNDPMVEASLLFRSLNYELEQDCLCNKSNWWFRTYEGHCNWLKKGESGEGSVGSARPRDYQQYVYADSVSKPREGPNPRAVSNAFFKRKKKIYYDHTPLLLGLIEFIMHDVTYSQDSINEFIEVPMPEDEEIFPLNTTLKVPRTQSMPGTGTSRSNPRENMNMATAWLDISSLYGSNSDVAHRLRSKIDGKLLTQEIQPPGTKETASYLPFNTLGVPINTRPGVKPEELFAGGDPRTNEDWLLLGIHTLLLREHNRLCDILKKQKPGWDDEQLYQTVRLVMSAKHALIANAYQMAYWTEEMPWPRDDGFPLYRQMFGENALEINPANTYPWPLVTKNGKPMTVSAEMAVIYRFHEFIIPSFPIKDQNNKTLWEQNLFDTSFNSTGFLDVGLERILAGALSSHIPNFKSGVDESFRSAGFYRGRPFDIVVSSIVHEREQGLPTFNQYFRQYNAQDPEVVVPIRDTWEKFSTDPQVIQDLKKLYTHPDDVDLVVGCQLDEEWFPGTTVPKSALIISLFSLFGMGNSDRFSIGFAMMRCLLVDRPWDCHPSNALEDLIWERMDVLGFPNFRFYSDFWVRELDLPAHGTNLLWRLITENSEINCLQRSPLFPPDRHTNPVLCSREASQGSPLAILFKLFQIALSLLKQGPYSFIATAIITAGSGILAIIHYLGWKTSVRRKT
ncbi:hypothetical protein FGADI_6367 [Fusarium gaditjirri]|uniref:Ankyrin n=1 Tax=Fusarium gaditjirri TaxID=282569 RepID=A0A8H4T7W8_9HYPO|nr:hypothetical protein FGADI_6367 [Fusarium gaditjirri]